MERSLTLREPRWLALVGVLALATPACDAPPDVRTSQAPIVVEAAKPAPQKHDVSTHAVDQLHVAWPDRSLLEDTVLDRLPEEARASIERSTLPVLVPRTGGLTERTQLAVKPAFYAASIRGEGEHAGIHVSVSATKIMHRYPGMPRAEKTERVRGDKPAWVLQNEGIWSVTWEEHGVTYVVELECARPYEDARCASAEHVVKIADELAFVGGTFDGGVR